MYITEELFESVDPTYTPGTRQTDSHEYLGKRKRTATDDVYTANFLFLAPALRTVNSPYLPKTSNSPHCSTKNTPRPPPQHLYTTTTTLPSNSHNSSALANELFRTHAFMSRPNIFVRGRRYRASIKTAGPASTSLRQKVQAPPRLQISTLAIAATAALIPRRTWKDTWDARPVGRGHASFVCGSALAAGAVTEQSQVPSRKMQDLTA
ncbi:uncharacterized protein IWZ02DRAFT_487368 [Phyllosticta citriasiana]|uniref:uncharacterized protein n=1 Tax=Phyllosticta citriasiana TaxID=595635 RepID=UPI0030FD22C1